MATYVDVSGILQTQRTTGIQRVVCELVSAFAESAGHHLIRLVRWSREKAAFESVDLEQFVSWLAKGGSLPEGVVTGTPVDVDGVQPGSILLDMDNNWVGQFDTPEAYGLFHKAGGKIARLVYDVIPVLAPQFVHPDTERRFLTWLPAVLTNADLLLVNASATRDELGEICGQLGVECPPVAVFPLGGGLHNPPGRDLSVGVDAIAAAQSGPFVLMVGTVEPRKNHAYVLDAFETDLFARGISLVIVGKRGWQNEELLGRLDNSALLGERLFYLDHASDADLAFLYDRAKLLAFPSALEGYGLPIVEALQRGLPVLASDTRISREVGGDWCDYFSLDDMAGFIAAVGKYSDDEFYGKKRAHVARYQPISWEQSATALLKALDTLLVT